LKFAEIGKKIDKSFEKTKEKTNKVTKNIKGKVYMYEEKTKLNEIEDQIMDLTQDLVSELIVETENESIAEFQNKEGYRNFIEKLKENNIVENNIYKIRMLQYKKEVTKKRIKRSTNNEEN